MSDGCTLAKIKDIFSIFGTVIAVGSLCVAAYQFYLSRLAIQSQTITSATAITIQIQAEILRSPDIFAKIYVPQDQDFVSDTAVRQLLAAFVVLYYAHEKMTLPNDAWDPLKKELCDLAQKPKVAPIVAAAIKGKQYPDGFLRILASC